MKIKGGSGATFPWKENTYYLVQVRLFDGNPTHWAIFHTGFLNGPNKSPGGYSCVWNASYDGEWTREVFYMDVVRELFDERGFVGGKARLPDNILGITAAAIKDDSGKVWSVPRPGRHHDVMRWICDATGREFVPHNWEQGFVGSDENFYGRRAARSIAFDAGQLLPRAPKSDQLYSEDVW